ncbi:hypothetical protein [Flavobacterium panacagri]|uniref:hypothetical protein n=1 Tax=Flavobacterium panacagri TaxID=3034146 RepID=UPI0025A56AE7|nr:hypothetical protein [Flavobacterium panacagri]
MKPEEAIELRLFLTNQLERNGFFFIAEQANKRLQEKFEYDPERSYYPKGPDPERLLVDFLSETIELFRNNSNENYGGIIAKINKNLNGEKIEGIMAELPGESEPYDLSRLPNYSEVYHMLGMVRESILKNI